MSYLSSTRLTFAGRFQADVSTVNNDVRHFDDAAFSPNWQELSTKENANGWWNPTGSGAFRFVNARVTAAQVTAEAAGSASDPVIGSVVTGADDRSAGKLVDLDPQWQLASAPWGLAVMLVGTDGQPMVRGEFKANAFRDLWFTRNPGKQGDPAASSTFQSVLTDVVYDEQALQQSPALQALQAASLDGMLSIRLTTFGFDGTATSPTFTIGTLVGAIGPALAGEPESYIRGRRFAPASGFSSYGSAISYFSGALVTNGSTASLLLDLSNALSISDPAGTAIGLGRLSVGVLSSESVVENTPVTANEYSEFAVIDYLAKDWLQTTSGIVEVPLNSAQFRAALNLPLALVNNQPYNPGSSGEPGSLGVVAVRETAGGLAVGAEPSTIRLDPPAGRGFAAATVTLSATRYGVPLSDVSVSVSAMGRVPGQGGGAPPDAPDVAKIAIPDIGVPETAVQLSPASVPIAGGAGEFQVAVSGPGNPRGYIDGQLYLIDFRLPGQPNASRHPFDLVIVHARDAYASPAAPTWSDVQPILTQYANLYPIMSRGFIDLADETAVNTNRDLLLVAFGAPIEASNHMPVTRDLSDGKRQTILRYLAALPAPQSPPSSELDAVSAIPLLPPRPTSLPVPPPADRDPIVDSKERFALGFLHPTAPAADPESNAR